ncbi:32866_t:CDS:1, partial [Racocetra persica]
MSLQDSESKNFYIKVYNLVLLENREILKVSDSYQDKEWFSDIVVFIKEDQEQCESNK